MRQGNKEWMPVVKAFYMSIKEGVPIMLATLSFFICHGIHR
jgi:hypothetical protein